MEDTLSPSLQPAQLTTIHPEINEIKSATSGSKSGIKSLPRSIRWRLQLGVWKYPLLDETHNDDVNNPTMASSSSTSTRQTTLIQNIWEHNRDLVEIQRSNYNLLVEMLQEVMNQDKHSDEDNPITHKDKTNHLHECISKSDDHNQSKVSVEDIDPLTAMAKERDAQEQRLHELDIQYRKRRARRRLGVTPDDKDRGDIYSVSELLKPSKISFYNIRKLTHLIQGKFRIRTH
jgi:hypothetical protein